MDIFSVEKRSEVMSRVKGKDTKPELSVRRYLHARGLRYRLHSKGLPGKPDIVFPTRRVAVFIHGCFWHGHAGCKRATIPATRSEFWQAKIGANKERDINTVARLEAAGWTVVILWQCEISEKSLQALYATVAGAERRKDSARRPSVVGLR